LINSGAAWKIIASRTGFWLALAVFICHPAFTGGARKLISKTVDATVTSVLQTTAGKMIFAKFDERHQTAHEEDRPAREGLRVANGG